MQFAEFALNFLEETEGDFFFRQTLIFSFSEYCQGIEVAICKYRFRILQFRFTAYCIYCWDIAGEYFVVPLVRVGGSKFFMGGDSK